MFLGVWIEWNENNANTTGASDRASKTPPSGFGGLSRRSGKKVCISFEYFAAFSLYVIFFTASVSSFLESGFCYLSEHFPRFPLCSSCYKTSPTLLLSLPHKSQCSDIIASHLPLVFPIPISEQTN